MARGRKARINAVIALILFLIAGAALFGYAVGAPRSQVLGKTLFCAPPESAPSVAPGLGSIALTFDDGPGESTPEILDLLRQAGIRATFFLCGSNVERYPDLARRIAEEGHEIGNHTFSHPYLLFKTPGKIAWEIERAQNVIVDRTGSRPVLFRPPYGVRWFGLFPILAQRQMTPVMWSVSGFDWRWPADRIARRILRRIHPGAIILLHDGVPPTEPGDRRETARALREIVAGLSGKYRCVTVSEML